MKKLGVFLLGLAGIAALCAASAYFAYEYRGTLCQNISLTTQVEVGKKEKAITKADLKRSYDAGAKQERDRQALDKFFEQLNQEALNAPPDPVDDCRLPYDRLRRWNAANAGPSQGQSRAQSDHGTTSAATGEVGPDTRPGGEPPAGDQGVPLAGEQALSAAGVPGADAR